ncbi:MAG TPA: TolC family protein [Methylocella sp.]|nr:TolC family protein [Methylocella sp.]
MPRIRHFTIAASGAGLLIGCATSAIDMAPNQPDRPWTPPTETNGEIIAGAKPDEDKPSSSYVLPPNPAAGTVPPALDLKPDKAYNLPELIDIAQSNNPLTRIAWNNARDAALAAGIVQSAYLPRLSANALGGYQTAQGQSTALGVSTTNSVSASGGISALSLQWLLFDFGERAAAEDVAKQGSVLSNIGFTAAHQQLIYSVSVAFYAYSAARARAVNATQTLRDAQAVQAAAEDRLKHQIGTVTEVAQARQATAQARFALVQAEGAQQNGYLSLLSAMGISPLNKIKIADTSGRQLKPAMKDRIDSILSAALARRPDVLAAFATERASSANIRAAEAEFLPKLFVTASGGYNFGGLEVTAVPAIGAQGTATYNISGTHLNATVLAGVTVPLYDGGVRAAALEQAQTKADTAKLQLANTQQEAVRQIVFADNALNTSLSSYAAASELVRASQTSFDAALASYRKGVGSISDATLAETQLLQAKNARTDAYSTALGAAAALALATGSLGSAPP